MKLNIFQEFNYCQLYEIKTVNFITTEKIFEKIE